MILFGTNEFWNDLAIVVIWGLGTSLVLIILLMGVWEKVMEDRFAQNAYGHILLSIIIGLKGYTAIFLVFIIIYTLN